MEMRPRETARVSRPSANPVMVTVAAPFAEWLLMAAQVWGSGFQVCAAACSGVSLGGTVTITGFADGRDTRAVSRGRISIRTSKDPVGAPIFYRDVPLIPSPTVKGVIKPLPTFAIGLIAWRLRNVGETQSKTVMQGLPTCANCHSFSLDGKTLGLDVDGPQNDK